MLQIDSGPTQRLCDGTSRRDFLRVGFLGVLGLSLADVLRMEAAQAAQLGAAYHPLRTGDESYGNEGPQLPVARTGDLKPIPGVDTLRMLRRQSLLKDMDHVRREADRAASQTQMDEVQQKAIDMIVSGKA